MEIATSSQATWQSRWPHAGVGATNCSHNDLGDDLQSEHSLPEPWLAHKILAAGAIDPKVGLRSAFEHGTDFICVRMYDFQIVEGANIALQVLNGRLDRQRVWCA